MNTLFFSYALEVEKTASITRAADNLFMTQPTLSKAIKELEANVGFEIFSRTSKGVIPTRKGRVFLDHARKIVAHLDKMETDLRIENAADQVFSLAIPRVGYIARAAAKFVSTFDTGRGMELNIREASTGKIIEAVADGRFVLGIIRYPVDDEDYFLKRLAEKGLQVEDFWQSRCVVLMPEDHPLADADEVRAEDLAPYIEIVFGDEHASAVHSANSRRILVYDRATVLDLMRDNPLTYTWSSPLPQSQLAENNLVQRNCQDSRAFKDIIISRAGYRYSKQDRAFINELTSQRNEA